MYVPIEDIRSSSGSNSVIVEATNGQLRAWAAEAAAVINTFCNQDFMYEEGVEKEATIEGSTIFLPKVLASSDFTLRFGGEVVPPDLYNYEPGEVVIDYHSYVPTKETVTIHGSWGYSTLPAAIEVVFRRLVKRIAVRDNEEDFVQLNSGYSSESTGEGYNYSLANGTLRSLIRPEDFALLWPYVNHGTVVG